MTRTNIQKGFQTLALTLLLSVAMVPSVRAQDADQVADPFINVNRAIFSFNDTVDQYALRPIAKGYRYAVPRPARNGLRNFLRNLRAPVNLANELLQGNFEGAGTVLTRTTINTLIGIGGLIDVAGDEGIAYKQEDFGQTLGVWGVGNGPYIIIPLLGSSTIRDGSGLLVDGFLLDPLNWYLHNIDEDGWVVARFAANSLVRREELLDALDDLRRNSFDYYTATRSAYVQNRAAEVRNQTGQQSSSVDHP